MQVTLGKEIVEALGYGALKDYGASEDKQKWTREITVDLSNLTRAGVVKFQGILTRVETVRGVKTRLEDVARWLQIIDGDRVRCRHIKHFESMLKQYLKTAPKHWVYKRRKHAEVHQPYYVSKILYTPKRTDSYGREYPAYVTVYLWYEEFGKIYSAEETFFAEDCEDLTVGRALGAKGYSIETPELLAEYRANKERYDGIYNKVGLQFTAVGIGEPEESKKSYWWRRSSDIKLDKDGVPSRVVVDVLSEGDENDTEREHRPNGEYWGKEPCDYAGSPDDDDNDIKPGDEDPDEDHPLRYEMVDIPLAPALMCFDLRRQQRLKIYVDQLTQYVYRTDLAEKLILPKDQRDLVDLLVTRRGGFQDIVGGKGAGTVILCAGPPGTGKTLTSEVYSEAMSRPLYSVQCSQLGTDPETLETELLKVFARAARWQAILLLDEADVYVAARGRDLQQNAIVGVFLRVLEYYQGVMFMTTNRADLVDDAVASRCLARIDYGPPTPENQRRIWRTLADTAGIAMPDAEIRRVSELFPALSGRDVKNLLKLADMVATARGSHITAEIVKFVKAFKPTGDGLKE